MGGGASKKYAEPEPEKLPASGPILFSVVVDLDGSGNLASLDYREDHADPASAATEFVAQHDLSPAQVGPIAAAVARKRDVVEAERAQREEEAREYAARPRAKPPEGNDRGSPAGTRKPPPPGSGRMCAAPIAPRPAWRRAVAWVCAASRARWRRRGCWRPPATAASESS